MKIKLIKLLMIFGVIFISSSFFQFSWARSSKVTPNIKKHLDPSGPNMQTPNLICPSGQDVCYSLRDPNLRDSCLRDHTLIQAAFVDHPSDRVSKGNISRTLDNACNVQVTGFDYAAWGNRNPFIEMIPGSLGSCCAVDGNYISAASRTIRSCMTSTYCYDSTPPTECLEDCYRLFSDPLMRDFCRAGFNPEHPLYPGSSSCDHIQESSNGVHAREYRELCRTGWLDGNELGPRPFTIHATCIDRIGCDQKRINYLNARGTTGEALYDNIYRAYFCDCLHSGAPYPGQDADPEHRCGN